LYNLNPLKAKSNVAYIEKFNSNRAVNASSRL